MYSEGRCCSCSTAHEPRCWLTRCFPPLQRPKHVHFDQPVVCVFLASLQGGSAAVPSGVGFLSCLGRQGLMQCETWRRCPVPHTSHVRPGNLAQRAVYAFAAELVNTPARETASTCRCGLPAGRAGSPLSLLTKDLALYYTSRRADYSLCVTPRFSCRSECSCCNDARIPSTALLSRPVPAPDSWPSP